MRKRNIRIVAWICACVVITALAAVAVPQLRWRIHVIALHLAGEIPDIELGEVIAYMMPGSDQTMTFLIEKRNPYAVLENTHTTATDIEAGSLLYRDRCLACHGVGGAGGPGAPALASQRFKHGDTDWALYRTIRLGVAGTAMQPIPSLTDTQRWQLIAYVRSLGASGRTASPEREVAISTVSYEELAAIRETDEDWLTFSGTYSSTRHSSLALINRANVHQLALRWLHQFEHNPPVIEATPLVRDGTMFLSVPPCVVMALDAATGKERWRYACELQNDSAGAVGGSNTRGIALAGDKVYFATWDARLIALSAKNGQELWQTTVTSDNKIYYISSAPLAYRDLVVTGVGTRQVGRGFIAAFDANTGKERWRFTTVPGPGEPGNETWAGDSWQVGGGPTWLTGSYDPEADLLYWNSGNPKPDYDAASRAGDNLYTNSVLALRGTTGKLEWHFQFTPADDKDWDANQISVLMDRDIEPRKLLLRANRNGFYYVLDRLTGKLVTGMPFVEQNWASGLDKNGRPIRIDGNRGLNGRLLFPGNVGGTNWWPPTLDPERNLMIVPTLEQGMVYFSEGNTNPRANGRPFYTAVRALDATTGKLVWEHRHTPRFVDNAMAGLISTHGDIVFGSDQSRFFGLDVDDGELLWSVETGRRIYAAPVTYSANGEQFVAIAAGGDLLVFGLPKQQGTSADKVQTFQ